MRNAIVAVFLLLSGCTGSGGSDDPGEPTKTALLARSLKVWKGSKPAVYSYDVFRSYGSAWETAPEKGKWITSISVRGDEVICRAFKQTGNVEKFYKEIGTDVGTEVAGFRAVTMESLYRDCAELLEEDSESVAFSVNEDGILQSCFRELTEEQIGDLIGGRDISILLTEFHPGDNCSLIAPATL